MKDRFWTYICLVTQLWQIAIGLVTVILILSLFSLLSLEPGSESYYIAQFNLVLMVPLLFSVFYIIRKCEQMSDHMNQ